MQPPDARIYALVPCAGSGTRAAAGGPKQYVRLAGQAMVSHTLAALMGVERIAATLVVLAAEDDAFESHVPWFLGPRAWAVRCGGPSRAASVRAGLAQLAQRGARPDDWVLVHDAARCLLRPQWVMRLIQSCADEPVGGLLALPMADTLKQESLPSGTSLDAARVACTVDRRGKWAAQTPQMFRLGLLQQALEQAGDGVTDEASALESIGHSPRLVTGELENFKVTFAGDFALAQRLLLSAKET